MLTKEKNLLSFLGSSGVFKPEHIDRDLQFIEYYYRDKGYLKVQARPPEITISPDKRFLFITFPIHEGPRIKVGRVDFKEDEIVPSEKVLKQLKLKEGEYFSLSLLQADMRMIASLIKRKLMPSPRSGHGFPRIRRKRIQFIFSMRPTKEKLTR